MGRQQVEQPRRHLAGELLEERRAVVGSHVVEDARHLLVAEALQQLFLRIEGHVLEGVSGEVARQQPEEHGALVGWRLRQELRQVLHREVEQELAQLGEAPPANELREVGLDEVAEQLAPLPGGVRRD